MMEKAIFGAGCFWGVEAAFREVKGVSSVAVGYAGGAFENPTYEAVCSGQTGHAEVVEIDYNPNEVTYEELLEVLWKIHNPTTMNRQGPDVGTQYRSAIFYTTPEQESAATASKDKLEKSGTLNGAIVTEISAASKFYKAEEYHQQYFEKHGISHCRIS
jgi:peptide-methionine (S)-S-oxide reductase